MAYINDKNLPYLVEKLSNADNIKINNNKHGSRVSTVINSLVAKSDNITKAVEQEIINDSYSFKVGTGNVDVSSDVEDGFGEVGVKGVTYQNLFNDFSFSGEASKYITANGSTIKWTKSAVTNFNINIKYHNALVELNRVYTLVFYVYKNTLQKEGQGDSYNVAKFNIVSYNSGVYLIPVNKTGLVKVKLQQPTTTPSDGKPYLEVYKDMVGELEISYPILLEGDYTNDDKIPSQFEGIVGVGNKSKNLFNGELEFGGYTGSAGTPFVDNRRVRSKSKTFLSSGSYVVSCEKSTLISICEYNVDGTFIKEHLADSNKKYFELSGDRLVHIQTVNSNLLNSKIQLEKGSTHTEYQPYGTHKIEILSCGKNLINIKDIPLGNLENSGKVVMSPTSAYKVTPNFIKIEPTRKVCFYYEYDENNTSTPQHNMIAYYDENFSYLGAIYDRLPKGAIITPHTKAKYIRLRVRKETVKLSLVFSSDIIYEPYTEDKTQILLDEPLMRLPNGVCDEITRDGKLIRRVGKIVLNGSENYIASSSSENTMYFILKNLIAKKGGYCISNNFYFEIGSNDNEHIRLNANGNIVFWIKTSKLASQDSAGVKQWLSQNPTTVYYELAEPIITELPAPYLRMFKDGHLTFNTLVAPESTHVVQLNKSAQIERSIREVQSLDGRVGQLESFYDNMMLETSYKLNLLNYDFEYTKEREDE